MFVIDVPITFFLGWPTVLKVLALLLGALPRTRMGLLMLGQVTRPLELLLAITADVHDITGFVRLPATSHGASDALVILGMLVLTTRCAGGLRANRTIGAVGPNARKVPTPGQSCERVASAS